MKATTKVTPTKWVQQELTKLDRRHTVARRRYRIFSSVLALLNLATIVIAGMAIYMMANWKPAAGSKVTSTAGLILTIFAAILVIAIFAINFGISMFKAYRRTKFYSEAREKILIENMKFVNGLEEYKSKDEKVLVKNVHSIKNGALRKRRSKDKKLKAILKGLTGGFDD